MKYYKAVVATLLTGFLVYYILNGNYQMATFYLGLIILNNQK